MFLTSPNLSAPNIQHGFFTRKGGKSSGIYGSLNCGYGSGDDIDIVCANRTIVADMLGTDADSLCTAFQIHSNKVITLDRPWHWKDAPEADALVTKTPGIALGILSADCLPVLFADTKRNIIGAAHAGWKGAFSGIIEATIEAMEQLGAQKTDIAAAIGPGIAQKSYEVGAEFQERFVQASAVNNAYFIPSPRPSHFLFDLKAYAKDRLEKSGIAPINVLAQDTCLQEDTFFSFRRATLRGEPVYGRQISAIMLKK